MELTVLTLGIAFPVLAFLLIVLAAAYSLEWFDYALDPWFPVLKFGIRPAMIVLLCVGMVLLTSRVPGTLSSEPRLTLRAFVRLNTALFVILAIVAWLRPAGGEAMSGIDIAAWLAFVTWVVSGLVYLERLLKHCGDSPHLRHFEYVRKGLSICVALYVVGKLCAWSGVAQWGGLGAIIFLIKLLFVLNTALNVYGR